MGGIELITQIVAELKHKRATDNLRSIDFDEALSSIGSCITNMHATNAFMLMTINRCIDYTKASNGVALIPKCETVNLVEALALPLNCMKGLQQQVEIKLLPIANAICTHVITDKQWLQENILCLLSNAVKYSSEGLVTLSVTKELRWDYVMTSSAGMVRAVGEFGDLKGVALSSEALPARQGSASESNTDLQDNAPTMEKVRRPYLRFEVEDRGIGLSEEAMETLFRPFKQAQRLAGGTGLGLFSLAKRVEALEGRCGVQKRWDGQPGSLFWFEIPYRPDRALAMSASNISGSQYNLNSSLRIASSDPGDPLVAPAAHSSAAISPSPASPPRQLSILVVDDAPAIVKMTTMMLKRHTHFVSQAKNGAEAVKVVQLGLELIASQSIEHGHKGGHVFDVILMDLQMPVMDGLEATRRVRAMEQEINLRASSFNCLSPYKQAPVHHLIIGVSANSDAGTASEALEAGMDGFVAKPFTLETFYRVIHGLHL